MARRSIIERELKKGKLVNKFAAKRKAYKDILSDVNATDDEKWEARSKLQALPRSSSPVRLTRRCTITGRPHGVYRKFKLSRNKLRKMAMNGLLPGVTKASW